jgi:hypothetical protein
MSSEKIEELVEGMTGIIVDQICLPVLEHYQSDEEDPGHSKADNDKNLRFFLTERTYTYDEMREEFDGVDFGVVEKTLGERRWAKIAEFDISGKYFNYFPAPECFEAAFVFVAHLSSGQKFITLICKSKKSLLCLIFLHSERFCTIEKKSAITRICH